MADRLLVLLKGYPRLSETFIAQEIRALERAGLDLAIVAMRRPHDAKSHPIHREIQAPVCYLPEYLHWEIARVFRALARARTLPGFGRAVRTLLADIRPLTLRDRLRRFGQAAVLATELAPDASGIYVHFIHTPASVARYASLMTGLDWMCSAHAKDIWTSPSEDLAAKLASARWTVTCTAAGRRRLAALAPEDSRVRLVYHGLDLTRFPPFPRPRSTADGSDPNRPIALLAVGRAVPKKGFDVLLEALARLPQGLAWRLTHIGGGGEREKLKRRAVDLGIADRIVWRGAEDQPTVLAAYRAADLFVLPCRIASGGDRDGLPNVLMEAQSQRLPCISTTAGAVPELIVDGETGLLVPPEDSARLADAILRLARHPDERDRLGAAGDARVRQHFDAEATIPLLLSLLAGAPAVAAAVRSTDARARPFEAAE